LCQRLGIREEDFLLSPRESARNCKQIVLLVEKRRRDVQRPGQTRPLYQRANVLASLILVDAGLAENSLLPSCSRVRPERNRA